MICAETVLKRLHQEINDWHKATMTAEIKSLLHGLSIACKIVREEHEKAIAFHARTRRLAWDEQVASLVKSAYRHITMGNRKLGLACLSKLVKKSTLVRKGLSQ
jgi:hypothetical protein